jgi:hypothetical protein
MLAYPSVDTHSYPKVTLNGTYYPVLRKQYEEALSGVEESIKRLEAVELHQRDYRSQVEFTQAVNERCDALAKLAEVQRYLNFNLEMLYTQRA